MKNALKQKKKTSMNILVYNLLHLMDTFFASSIHLHLRRFEIHKMELENLMRYLCVSIFDSQVGEKSEM